MGGRGEGARAHTGTQAAIAGAVVWAVVFPFIVLHVISLASKYTTVRA